MTQLESSTSHNDSKETEIRAIPPRSKGRLKALRTLMMAGLAAGSLAACDLTGGVELRTKYYVDQDFAARNGVEVPLEFSFSTGRGPLRSGGPSALRTHGLTLGLLGFELLDAEGGNTAEQVLVFYNQPRGNDHAERLAYMEHACGLPAFRVAPQQTCADVEITPMSLHGADALRCAMTCTQDNGDVLIFSQYHVGNDDNPVGVSIIARHYTKYSDVKTIDDIDKGLDGGLKMVLKTLRLSAKTKAVTASVNVTTK